MRSVSSGSLLCIGILLSGCQSSLSASHAAPERLERWTGEQALACSPDALADVGPLDVVFVIDASMSTRAASGVDIDGDGVVGAYRESVLDDPDDSRLGAQIHGVRALLELFAAADGADVRLALVSYAGSMKIPIYPGSRVVKPEESRVHVPLGGGRTAIAAQLDLIQEHGGSGTSHFYAGMRQANRVLLDAEPGQTARQRLVLFMADSHSPLTREPDGGVTTLDPHLEVATAQAREHDIVFNTFGISAESGSWQFDPIGWIAWETGGRYHRVEDPAALSCHLADAMRSPKEVLE